MAALLHRLGVWSHRRRRLVLVGWLAVLLAAWLDRILPNLDLEGAHLAEPVPESPVGPADSAPAVLV
jgi:hypothetical protein